MYSDYTDIAFVALVGKTLVKIDGLNKGSEQVVFHTNEGEKFSLFHEQSCCEDVEIYDITGDGSDLIGYPILVSEETSNEARDTDPGYSGYSIESGTWTFYHLRTVKGSVTIRWLGRSNGYYSERVSFRRLPD